MDRGRGREDRERVEGRRERVRGERGLSGQCRLGRWMGD